jgi:hypothetical protein
MSDLKNEMIIIPLCANNLIKWILSQAKLCFFDGHERLEMVKKRKFSFLAKDYLSAKSKKIKLP